MSCWRCNVLLRTSNDINICRLCEIEVDKIVPELVRIWRYSEDRLFKHRGLTGYRMKKLEVYSTLLYTYMWKMRMVDAETRRPLLAYSGDYRDAAGYSSLDSLNSKDFLVECHKYLQDQHLIDDGEDLTLLTPGVPECSL